MSSNKLLCNDIAARDLLSQGLHQGLGFTLVLSSRGTFVFFAKYAIIERKQEEEKVARKTRQHHTFWR